MKKFKKLIPAVCMLLVSAVLMGTSTFAWFSMNKTATVSGLSVKAQSDSIYLLISKDNTEAGDIQAENKATVDFEMGAATALKPSALISAATNADVKNTSLSVADLSNPGSWYTAFAVDSKASTVDQNTEEKLDAKLAGAGGDKYTFSDYVIKKDLYFTLAVGSNAAKDLKVDAVTFSSVEAQQSVNAVSVLFVCDQNAFVVKADGTLTDINGATVTDKTLASSLTAKTVAHVEMYIFYDGNNADVFTNNVANLIESTIDVTFSVDAEN